MKYSTKVTINGAELLDTQSGSSMEGSGDIIKNAFKGLLDLSNIVLDNSGDLIKAGMDMLKNLAKGIAQALPTVIETAPKIISNLANVINNNAPTINNYLTVQYLDPVNNQPMTSIFYPSDRKIEKYGNGMYKSISVTLTEV